MPEAFQFSLLRKGWYICRSRDKDYHRIQIVTDFHMSPLIWLRRCSFVLRPITEKEDPLMNCFNLLTTKPPVTLTKPAKPTTRATTGTTPHHPEGTIEYFRIIHMLPITRSFYVNQEPITSSKQLPY